MKGKRKDRLRQLLPDGGEELLQAIEEDMRKAHDEICYEEFVVITLKCAGYSIDAVRTYLEGEGKPDAESEAAEDKEEMRQQILAAKAEREALEQRLLAIEADQRSIDTEAGEELPTKLEERCMQPILAALLAEDEKGQVARLDAVYHKPSRGSAG